VTAARRSDEVVPFGEGGREAILPSGKIGLAFGQTATARIKDSRRGTKARISALPFLVEKQSFSTN